MSRVAGWKTLRPIAVDLEYVLAPIVRGCVQLHAKPRYLIFALEKVLWRYCDHWLRSPFRQGAHDVCRLFVRVDRTGIGVVVVFNRRIGIEGGLCENTMLVAVPLPAAAGIPTLLASLVLLLVGGQEHIIW